MSSRRLDHCTLYSVYIYKPHQFHATNMLARNNVIHALVVIMIDMKRHSLEKND